MRSLLEPGNGESHDSKGETSDEGEERKGESPRSESIVTMDSSENGKEKPGEETAKMTENPPKEEKEKEKEKVVEEETVAIPVSTEAEDVSVELLPSEKEEVGGGGGEESTEVAEEKSAAVASVVPVHEPVSVTEEVVEATEAAAVTSEALAHESEVKPFDTPLAPVIEQPQPRESERSEVTTERLKQVCRVHCFYYACFMLHYGSTDKNVLVLFGIDSKPP